MVDHPGRRLLEYEPTIGLRFIPGIKARIPHEGGGYLIRTNRAGFRCDREVSRERDKGFKRILLFGDSFTAGDGVSNRQRYGDLLEELIPGLQVLNFGLPASGTDQQYLAYLKYAADLDHDLLVIGVLVENIRRVVSRYRSYVNEKGDNVLFAKPYYELDGQQLKLRNVPVPKQHIMESELPASERSTVEHGGRFRPLRRLVTRLDFQDTVQRFTRYQPLPEYEDANHPAWLLMRAILQRWIEADPAPVLILPIPLHQYVEKTSDPKNYQARFRELEAATSCILHDPLPDFLDYPYEERRGFRFDHDQHLTPAGHAVLARSLAPTVERVLGLDGLDTDRAEKAAG